MVRLPADYTQQVTALAQYVSDRVPGAQEKLTRSPSVVDMFSMGSGVSIFDDFVDPATVGSWGAQGAGLFDTGQPGEVSGHPTAQTSSAGIDWSTLESEVFGVDNALAAASSSPVSPEWSAHSERQIPLRPTDLLRQRVWEDAVRTELADLPEPVVRRAIDEGVPAERWSGVNFRYLMTMATELEISAESRIEEIGLVKARLAELRNGEAAESYGFSRDLDLNPVQILGVMEEVRVGLKCPDDTTVKELISEIWISAASLGLGEDWTFAEVRNALIREKALESPAPLDGFAVKGAAGSGRVAEKAAWEAFDGRVERLRMEARTALNLDPEASDLDIRSAISVIAHHNGWGSNAIPSNGQFSPTASFGDVVQAMKGQKLEADGP